MKKLFFTLFCSTLFTLLAHAQDYNHYEAIKLDTKADYTPEVEKSVLEACHLLLSTPMEKRNMARLKSAQFLLRWMSGTPDYSFEIGETATKLAKSNEDLLVIYLAAMTKYCLENPEHSKDTRVVKRETIKSVIAYCKSQDIKMTGELKRLNVALEKGELEKYLSLQ